jgi:anti-sigma factor RsiW
MNEKHRASEDQLRKAISAFQRMTLPDRPGDADPLARLGRDQCEKSQRAFVTVSSKRRYLMRALIPSAVAAAILLAGLGLSHLNTPAVLAADDVSKTAEEHKLVRYKQQDTAEDKANGTGKLDYICYWDLKSPRYRVTAVAEGDGYFVTVANPDSGLILMINAHKKAASLHRIDKGSKGFLANLRNFQQKKGVTSVKEKLDGRETVKYQLKEEDHTVTVWVDPKTKLPVRWEEERIDPSPNVTKLKQVMSDFEWDPELPEGFKTSDQLFSTRAPDGYTVEDKSKKEE